MLPVRSFRKYRDQYGNLSDEGQAVMIVTSPGSAAVRSILIAHSPGAAAAGLCVAGSRFRSGEHA